MFLVKYRRNTQMLESVTEITPQDIGTARDERLRLEIQSLEDDDDLEVVILEAPSMKDLLLWPHKRHRQELLVVRDAMKGLAMDWIYSTFFKDPFCYACGYNGHVWDIYLHPIVGFELVENGKTSHGYADSCEQLQELAERLSAKEIV